TVNTETGAVPTNPTQDNDTWEIYRAHTSLANAESGTANSSLTTYGFSFTGGDRDISSGTGNNEQWNIACYANGTTADLAPGNDVTIAGWTTSEQNFVRVYSPFELNEVGVSQRHSGAWDTSKYFLRQTDGYGDVFVIDEEFVRIDGLQIEEIMTDTNNVSGFNLSSTLNAGAEIHISNSIIKASLTGTSSNLRAIIAGYHDTDDSNHKIIIYNNIIYDYVNGSYSDISAISVYSGWDAVIYNNTIYNSYTCIENNFTRVTAIAKNNIVQDCTVGYYGGYGSFSDYNITDEDAQDGAFGATHSTGTTDGVSASKLIDSGATFLTDGVQVGSIVMDTSNTQYSYVTALDSETQLSVNDDIFVSGENYSVYTNKYGAVTFENEGGDDFRLDQTDTLAIGKGTSTLADPNLSFNTDIEGDERNFNDSWDIGADEYRPTEIYRSVGPGSTDALEIGTDNPMTIVGDIATFTNALADNIGVGDAIQYDDDDDGDIDANDSIAFVTSRISNYQYQISNASGGAPTEVDQDTDWSLFRAYTSLANAESGTENTGIDSDLRNFDTFTTGRDLVTNGEQWNIACYGNGTTADTTAVDVNGWTTGKENYIKIFTPTEADEVGVTQRHSGIFDTNRYYMERTITGGYGFIIDINVSNVRIDGLQFHTIAGASDSWTITSGADGGKNIISNNIFKGNNGSSYDYFYAIDFNGSDSGINLVFNNI
ncbi:hypothetical protein N9934_05585, partial [Desulfosarcina sp.]|nr:hypothetical protein [Desulfosarcina sp.]